jgi:hypothetical protein
MLYNHTQIGYLMIYTTLAVILLFGWIATFEAVTPNLIGFMMLIILIMANFFTLTVTVDDQFIKIKFGYGLYQKKIAITELVSAIAVKNRWYYGWGIRYWFWPRMWIFNVSGFDAVEIKTTNGKIFRIGSDDSSKLETILKQKIK